MKSIIEEIAAAEQKADEIRQQAASEAREAVSFAQSDAEAALADADADERNITREALLQAEHDGDAAAREILNRMEREADTLCDKARKLTGDAAAYLVKRVTEAS